MDTSRRGISSSCLNFLGVVRKQHGQMTEQYEERMGDNSQIELDVTDRLTVNATVTIEDQFYFEIRCDGFEMGFHLENPEDQQLLLVPELIGDEEGQYGTTKEGAWAAFLSLVFYQGINRLVENESFVSDDLQKLVKQCYRALQSNLERTEAAPKDWDLRSKPPHVRERAVRLLLGTEQQYDSRRAAAIAIAEEVGCTPPTLLRWVQEHEKTIGQPNEEEAD